MPEVQLGLHTPGVCVGRQVSCACTPAAASERCSAVFSSCSCIFVWKLDGHMTGNMRKILRPAHQQPGIR